LKNTYISCFICGEAAIITHNKHDYCVEHYHDRKTLDYISFTSDKNILQKKNKTR